MGRSLGWLSRPSLGWPARLRFATCATGGGPLLLLLLQPLFEGNKLHAMQSRAVKFVTWHVGQGILGVAGLALGTLTTVVAALQADHTCPVLIAFGEAQGWVTFVPAVG